MSHVDTMDTREATPALGEKARRGSGRGAEAEIQKGRIRR